MDTSTTPISHDAGPRPNRRHVVRVLLCTFVLAGTAAWHHAPGPAALAGPECCTSVSGSAGGVDTTAVADRRSSTCCRTESVTSGVDPSIESAADGDGVEPDRTSDHPGGTAARLRSRDGGTTLGVVFLLMAGGESTRGARVFDTTAYAHENGTSVDTFESNVVAADIAGDILGTDVDVVEYTSAPGGGRSGGVTYFVGYLNAASDGAFTHDVRVAATGRLEPEGHLSRIDDIDAKVTAAHLADADVLFTPVEPSSEAREEFGARFVSATDGGRVVLARRNDPDRIRLFHRWGANRPEGMDIVHARHLIDVASYLCGAGSVFACDVVNAFDRQAHDDFARRQHDERAELERLRNATGH